MKLSEASIGQTVVVIENMDGEEKRWVFYQRAEGEVRYPNNVPVYRTRCVQGVPNKRPRFDVQGKGYLSEADRRIGCVDAETVHIYSESDAVNEVERVVASLSVEVEHIEKWINDYFDGNYPLNVRPLAEHILKRFRGS